MEELLHCVATTVLREQTHVVLTLPPLLTDCSQAEAESVEGGGPTVTDADIANITAQWTGIPIEKVSRNAERGHAEVRCLLWSPVCVVLCLCCGMMPRLHKGNGVLTCVLIHQHAWHLRTGMASLTGTSTPVGLCVFLNFIS